MTSDRVRMNGRDYRLDEFTRVWHKRGRRRWSGAAGRGALGLAMLAPIVLGVLGIAVAFAVHASVSATIALIGGGLLLGLAGIPLADVLLDQVDRSYDRGSRRLEIWGRTRNGDVLLLRTDNAQRFGQIYRGLTRALETPAQRW